VSKELNATQTVYETLSYILKTKPCASTPKVSLTDRLNHDAFTMHDLT